MARTVYDDIFMNIFSLGDVTGNRTVQKSVTTEEPIKFDVGKRGCKFS